MSRIALALTTLCLCAASALVAVWIAGRGSPDPAASTGWLIAKSRSFVVVRMPATVVFDSSAFFSSDRTAVRAVMRVSPAFPDPASVVHVRMSGS